MHVTRFGEAPEYMAPGHIGMRCLRMLGKESGPADFAWMGLSIIESGGSIEAAASPFEKLYLVLDGELEFRTPGESNWLTKWDACRVAPNEERTIVNLSSHQATVMLVMANIQL